MQFALFAETERQLNRRDQAIQHAKEALNASKGVKRYMLTKEYERYYTNEQQAQ